MNGSNKTFAIKVLPLDQPNSKLSGYYMQFSSICPRTEDKITSGLMAVISERECHLLNVVTWVLKAVSPRPAAANGLGNALNMSTGVAPFMIIDCCCCFNHFVISG